jgi:general secretion pathway protein E
VPSYLINATLLGVMAQRLVRTLCPNCKEDETIDPQLWTEFTNGSNIEQGSPAKPVGCLECRQTGYLGRVGLYEMLSVDESLKSHIQPDSDLSSLRAQALSNGLQTLRVNGAKKVAAGITTIKEVLRVTPFNM